ncbi:MAG TPA: hypothetical protein VGB82_22155 [Alphaproteobacteria bacterium]
MTDDPLNPEAYRSRAAQLRERAASCATEADKAQLLSVAEMFDQLAEKVERIGRAIEEEK